MKVYIYICAAASTSIFAHGLALLISFPQVPSDL
jgi:hypothetical protein